jgi:hypothetical protein
MGGDRRRLEHRQRLLRDLLAHDSADHTQFVAASFGVALAMVAANLS